MIYIAALNQGEAKRAAKVNGITKDAFCFITKAAELKPATSSDELWLVKGWERWPEFNISIAMANRKGMTIQHRASLATAPQS